MRSEHFLIIWTLIPQKEKILGWNFVFFFILFYVFFLFFSFFYHFTGVGIDLLPLLQGSVFT